jgi:phospholipase C
MRRLAGVILVLVVAAGCSSSSSSPKAVQPTTAAPSTSVPRSTSSTAPRPTNAPIGHVFLINLENKSYDQTWGAASPARYLNSLVPTGTLLTQYYGVGHASLDNYIAEISGQPPNPATRADCVKYTEYANGTGCVYPSSVKTIADQLAAAGKTWKSYQEDMGTPCRHPAIGTDDTTLAPRPGDQYATRHNPFVYFHSIIDTPACAKNVVDLKNLDADLASADATPNLAFITPNVCHDGHDSPCVDGEPGGLTSADRFLQTWVPKITRSPAYQREGLLIVTFDEAEAGDASACCGEPAPGGGRIGALLLSSHVRAGAKVATPYNHYAMLCSVEEIFGLARLANAAAPGLRCFSTDVYRRVQGVIITPYTRP